GEVRTPEDVDAHVEPVARDVPDAQPVDPLPRGVEQRAPGEVAGIGLIRIGEGVIPEKFVPAPGVLKLRLDAADESFADVLELPGGHAHRLGAAVLTTRDLAGSDE